MAFDRAAAGVVRGEREAHIAIVLIEQQTQVAARRPRCSSLASKTLHTLCMRAVAGISCISPSAPFGERAYGTKSDSARMTALTSAGIDPVPLRGLGDQRIERLASCAVLLHACGGHRIAAGAAAPSAGSRDRRAHC